MWKRLKPSLRSLIIGGVVAIILVVMLVLNLFSSIQLTINNIFYVPQATSGNIVIVALDDASFQAFGRTPTQWSRRVYTELVDELNRAGARVIAFDVIFSEATTGDTRFIQALEEAQAGENRIRTVFASAGVGFPLALSENFVLPVGIGYENILLPTVDLRQTADYLGVTNAFPDTDGRIRRQPSVIDVNGELNFSFSIMTYLAFQRISTSMIPQLVSYQDGILSLTPQRTFEVDENGFWKQNFFGLPNTTFPTYSLRSVLNGEVDTSVFNDKIVMIGISNSLGATDQAAVPISSQPMAGVEIQANAVETLIQGSILSSMLPQTEIVIIVVFALLSTYIYSQVRWQLKFILMFVFCVVWIVFALTQFSTTYQVFPLFYPTLALIFPMLITLGFNISDEITLRIRAQAQMQLLEQLKQKTEAENKLLAELNIKTNNEKKALEDLNVLKTRMIRMASHDLKNPLGRVVGYSELLLEEDELTEDMALYITNILRASDEMNDLIIEILDQEQLRAGVLQRMPLSFSKLVREVVTRHEPDFVRKAQKHSTQIPSEDVMIEGDTRQLSQAVSNLIGNASKYTPDKGKIEVRVFVKDEVVHLEVQDTGFGIPSEALPKLFTEFFRVKTEATKNISGTGLGLNLVKNVIDAHSGEVWVQSEEGKGSTFFVTLPIIN
jgi:signal transduction histidine kinase